MLSGCCGSIFSILMSQTLRLVWTSFSIWKKCFLSRSEAQCLDYWSYCSATKSALFLSLYFCTALHKDTWLKYEKLPICNLLLKNKPVDDNLGANFNYECHQLSFHGLFYFTCVFKVLHSSVVGRLSRVAMVVIYKKKTEWALELLEHCSWSTVAATQ